MSLKHGASRRNLTEPRTFSLVWFNNALRASLPQRFIFGLMPRGCQISFTCVPIGHRPKSSSICSLNSPMQPDELLRPILRVSWVP